MNANKSAALIYHQNELKELQLQLGEANRMRLNLKDRMEKKVKLIKDLTDEDVFKPIRPNYTTRDIDLCKYFIIKNPGCQSSDIVDYLNKELVDQYVRWKVLDANTFMTYMGNYLKKSNLFVHDKKHVGKRQTTVWTIK